MTEEGKKVKVIREPGGTNISEKIRDVLLDKKNSEMLIETELILFAASRAQLVGEVILPLLDENSFVISDRFHDSSLAYQAFGRGIDLQFVDELQKFVIGRAVPDLTFLIDIPIEEVVKRKALVNQVELDRIERSKMDFYEKVREGYLFLASREPRYRKIDGLLSIEKIHQHIVEEIKKYLKG